MSKSPPTLIDVISLFSAFALVWGILKVLMYFEYNLLRHIILKLYIKQRRKINIQLNKAFQNEFRALVINIILIPMGCLFWAIFIASFMLANGLCKNFCYCIIDYFNNVYSFNKLFDGALFGFNIAAIIMLIGTVVAIFLAMKNYNKMQKEIKFYLREYSTHDYRNKLLNASKISFTEICDALDKKRKGIILEEDFIRLRNHYFNNYDPEIIEYKRKLQEDTKPNIFNLITAIDFRDNKLMSEDEFNQIKNNFIVNPDISIRDFTILAQMVLAKEIDLSDKEFEVAKTNFMRNNKFPGKQNISANLKELLTTNIITQDEYKFKKRQRIREEMRDFGTIIIVLLIVGVCVAIYYKYS